MSEECEQSELDMDETIQEVITKLFDSIARLERSAKIPPLPTTYRNDSALLQKVGTLPTKVAEQERYSTRMIIQSAAPPPYSAAVPPRPAPTARPLPQ